MSRSASKRPSTSTTRSGSTLQTTLSTSHDFKPSPLDAILAEQGLQRYRLEPPSWRAPWVGSDGSPNGDVEEDEGKRGLTWPVFYPTKDGMDEDQLTEAAVKQGYAAKLPIQADTFSAHGHILDNLKAKGMLENLSRIVTAVQQKREANLPTYGPSTFRLPSRITLTDSKREAWFSDLANPSVPLSKLSRSVPHGYKGEKGLDMLAMRKVEIGRAVWFVRAFGGVEIQSLAKSRPLPTAIFQYTSEFTVVVCEFIRKQLLDLALPDSDTPTPSIPNHSRTRTTSAGLMSSVAGTRALSDFKEPLARTAWKEKFDYTLSLVASLLSASLLSTPQFTRFMVSLVDPAYTTLAQLSIALFLIEEYWNEVLEDESCTARLARSCLIRLEELENVKDATLSPLYTSLAITLTSLVRSAFLALPDAFVSLSPTPIFPSTTLSTSPVPLLPAQISEKLENVLLEPVSSLVTADDIDQDPSVLAIIRSDLADLAQRRRLENLQVTTPTNSVSDTTQNASSAESRERAQLDLISHLDNFAFPQTIASLHSQLFVSSTSQTPTLSASSSSPNPSFVSPTLQTSHVTPSDPPRPRARSRSAIVPLEDALPTLFTWSTTPCRSSSQHRRYTVANLVSLELERQKSIAEKERVRQGARTRSKMLTSGTSGSATGKQGVAEIFVKWIDERYGRGTNADSLKTNKQIGSREDVRALAEELMRVGAIRHGGYMQRMIARGETERKAENGTDSSMHLWILKTAAIDEQNDSRSAIVESLEVSDQLANVKEELAKVIPGWNGDATRGDLASNTEEDARVVLDAVSRLTDIGHRLTVTRKIVPDGFSNVFSSPDQVSKITDETFAMLVEIFTRAYDFVGLSRLVVILLQNSPTSFLLVAIADLVSARLDLWTALGNLSQMAEGLYSNLEASGGSTRRRLLACLRPLALAGYLKGQATETVLTASQALITVPVQTSNLSTSIPSPLVDLQTLTIDSSPIAVSQLVTTLFGRYGHSSSDSWITLIIDSGIQLLSQLPTINPIVSLLKELDERLPEGLEPTLIRWMRAKNPQHLVSILGGTQGSQLVGLLSELVIEGVLSLPLLVSEGFLPIWRSILVLVLPEAAQIGTEPLPLDTSLSRALSVLTEALARAFDVSPITSPNESSDDYPFPRAVTLPILFRQQRKSFRLGGLFSTSAVPAVSSLLSLLVLQQEVFHAAGSTQEAQNASSLFLQIVNLEQFQSVVIKVPQSIRMGMLESDFVKSLPSFEIFKPKLLAGLLVALKDGGEATPANLVSTEDWDIFLSGLTMWRLAISKVEVEACLERLELDSTLTTEDKDGALHTLSNHFLERVCTGEGQTYLGEQVVKCYHGTASDELVSVAFNRLAASVTILSTSNASTEAYTPATTASRCTIRLLETLLQSGVASARPSSLRLLLEAVKGGLGELLKLNTSTTALAIVPTLISIVGIALRCTDAPSEKATADLYLDCLSLCANLAISINGPDQESLALSTVLLDTCSHLLLALPDFSPSLRPPPVQRFLHPSPDPVDTRSQALDLSLPDSTFVRLTHLFGSYAPACPVPNPWELLDHGEPISTASSTTIAASNNSLTQRTASPIPPGSKPPLTNLGPIDLAAFRAKVVETVPSVTALDALSTTSSSSTSSARPSSFTTTSEPRGKQINFDFETPCTGLSVQAKDHRRTISLAKNLALKFDQTANSSATLGGGAGNVSAGRKRNVTGGEVVANKSSSSTVGNGGTPATSSAQSTNGSGSSAPSTRGTKRKGTTSSNAEVLVIDDEDDEETSQPAKPPPAKKGKTTAAKGTRKKR